MIELILVMGLLVVILALAGPSLASFFRGRALHAEAERFLALTRYGQSRAVSEGIPMVLWINATDGTYGLEEREGYSTEDLKAVEFELAKGLEFEVDESQGLDELEQTQDRSRFDDRQTSWGIAAMNVRETRIQFLPDGSIVNSSPETILLREGDDERVWITRSENGLRYEIRQRTNVWEQAAP